MPTFETMPALLTKYFGSVEYREDDVVQFPLGLASFENESQFLLMEPPASAPLTFLQSVQLPGLCFLALPIQNIDPDYKLDITLEDLESLGLQITRQPRIGDEIMCFAVIVVAENGHVSANLLAPVVINPANRCAVQAIRIDSVYSHRHSVTEAVCL
jgi:flagellar assembly factor FliW